MSGFERPTVIEEIVHVFPGPYVLKCFIFASVFGVPLLLLTRFLDLFNVSSTLSIFGVPPLIEGAITFSVANFVLLFYATYSIRYMRLKIAQTLNELEQVTPEKRHELQKGFNPVCKVYPAVILGVLLFGATIASFPDILQHASGLLSLIQVAASFPLVYLAYGIFVWVYISSIRGIHELGKHSMPILEFYDDPHFGLKPLGSLSFSLALVYFAGLTLVFFSFISIPTLLEFAVGVLFLSGLVLFFLPLNVFHQKMRKKRREEKAKLKNYFKQLTGSIDNSSDGAYLADAKNARNIIALEVLERQMTATREWPFDFKTLTWLSAILLTVLASILTKYVLIFLGG